MSTSSYYSGLSIDQVLDDLQARFIINIPNEELSSVERICFQIEQAHWFYEDFVREENPDLPSFSLKNFCFKFFKSCPLLEEYSHNHEKAFSDFLEYKVRIPVCGAIILQEGLEHVLLVRGWKSQSSWSFPKGKINKDETEIACAIREVFEETGFDASLFIQKNEYIERTLKDQKIRLYILVQVPKTTVFETKTRKEIGDIKWFALNDLPGFSGKGKGKYKFHLVTAFILQLKKWINRYKKTLKRQQMQIPRKQYQDDYQSGSESDSESNMDAISPRRKAKEKALVLPMEKEQALLNVLKGKQPLKASETSIQGNSKKTNHLLVKKSPIQILTKKANQKNSLILFKFDVEKIMEMFDKEF